MSPRVPRLAEAASALLNDLPTPFERVPVVSGVRAPRPLRRGEPFTVLCWNVQFAATRRYHFFYDGGDDVFVAPEDVTDALAAIVARLSLEAADLTLLQELDRGSDRTGRVDELAGLLDAAPVARWVASPYHRCRYVPFPPRRPLGRIDLQLAILSRFELTAGERHALPRLREPWLRQQFNLQRALLSGLIPVEGGELAVATTHLSAFSRGDGTLPAQVAAVVAWVDAQRRAGRPFVLGGDFNLLPPGDDPTRLGAEAREYPEVPPPLAALLAHARSVFPVGALDARTYLPPGAASPDRQLDYLLVSDDVEVLDADVIREEAQTSDHLPLRARLRLR